MKTLTKERRGEICYKLILLKLKQEGFKLTDMNRQAGQIASQLKNEVTAEEIIALSLDMLPQLIGDSFGVKSVSLTLND